MKWRGRRVSSNIEDLSDPIADVINSDNTTYTGGVSPLNPPNKHTTKEIEVARQLGKYNREKRNPIPTPKPSQKTDRLPKIQHIQVTPGKWKTN
jgi:hypothetical protein